MKCFLHFYRFIYRCQQFACDVLVLLLKRCNSLLSNIFAIFNNVPDDVDNKAISQSENRVVKSSEALIGELVIDKASPRDALKPNDAVIMSVRLAHHR